MGRAEVLVPKITSGRQIPSSFFQMSCLTFMSSSTASITRSTSFISSRAVVGDQPGLDHVFQVGRGQLLVLDREVEGLPNGGHALLQRLLVDVPENRLEAVGQQQVDDARAHDPAAQHGHLFDLGRLETLDPGQPSGRAGVQENADQVLAHIGQGAVAKELRFPFDIRLDIEAQAFFHGLDGLEGGDITLGLVHGHHLGVVQEGLLFRGAGQPVDLCSGSGAIQLEAAR